MILQSRMEKILIIGSGAREHAIAKSLEKSKHPKMIYCLATNMNPGIAEICEEILIGNINDNQFVCDYGKEIGATIAIIGPENPLERGVSDSLWDNNISVVGPKRNLAQIETSKAFTRKLQQDYKIPGSPIYKHFKTLHGVEEFLKELGENYVVKYDGLAGGKGVKVSGEHLKSHKEALNHCHSLIKSNQSFLIEEKFIGQEFSLMSFCDGENLKHMPVVQDHKRAYEGDTGPNTGGMGTYTDHDHSLPFLNGKDIEAAHQINFQTAEALKEKFKTGYKGILYGGFMATKDGVRLIEYNARFGDPEAMNVLTLLNTDFIDICKGIVSQSLNKINVSFEKKATVCKYAVPKGYPEKPVKNQPVDISNIKSKDSLFYASVEIKNSQLVESGSRTMAIVGKAETITKAEEIAEKEICLVKGPLFHRKDIGTEKLIKEKVDQMKSLR